MKALSKLRVDNASRADDLSSRFLLQVKDHIAYPLLLLFRKSLEVPPPQKKKILEPKNLIFNCAAILRLYCKYLRTGTSYRQSENGIANCDHSHTCVPNLVNFGPQTAKMGPEFRPTRISQKQLFSDTHISGAKGHCPLKISSLVEDGQRLLMHTCSVLGDGSAPNNF